MNNYTLNNLDNATMMNTGTFRSTDSRNILLEICEGFAIDRMTSLTIYFIISLILFYITISLIVYSHNNNFLFKFEGTYEETLPKFSRSWIRALMASITNYKLKKNSFLPNRNVNIISKFNLIFLSSILKVFYRSAKLFSRKNL